MTALLKKPIVWINVAAFVFAGWIIASIAFGWTNPSSAPPGGSGAIIADSSGNVAIGTSISSSYKLNVGGSINGLSLCISGDCRTSWPGGVGGSGTLNKLAKFTGATTIGNSNITDDGANVLITGNVSWTGSLTSGNLPWARITSFPAGCPVGQVVRSVGSTLTCVAPTVITATGINATSASCPAGYRILSGVCGSVIPVLRTAADVAGTHYLDESNNRTVCSQTFNVVYARCIRL